MFNVTIKTGGAAFCDPYTGEPDTFSETYEVVRILEKIIRELKCEYSNGVCMDINGNKVGEWELR